MKYFLFLCSIMFLLSCGSENSENKSNAHDQTTVASNLALPVVPEDLKLRIVQDTRTIEVTFYDVPASASLVESNTQSFIGTISLDGIESHTCKPQGRAFFVSAEGDIFTEAEFFVGDGCDYYVFYRDGEKFGQMMSPTAKPFYDKFLNVGKPEAP